MSQEGVEIRYRAAPLSASPARPISSGRPRERSDNRSAHGGAIAHPLGIVDDAMGKPASIKSTPRHRVAGRVRPSARAQENPCAAAIAQVVRRW